MRLERGLSGKRSAETIIAESGSPGGELYDAIVPLRTSESCHYCPQLQTQRQEGTAEGHQTRELQGQGGFPTSLPEIIASASPPLREGSLRQGRGRPGPEHRRIVACRRRPPAPRAVGGVIEHRGREPRRAAWRRGLTASLNRLRPHAASALPWRKGRRPGEVLLQCSHPKPRAATLSSRAEPRAGSPGKPPKPGLPPAASAR